MLDVIKNYALEKYAGDEKKAQDFVDGFVKQAYTPPGWVANKSQDDKNPFVSSLAEGIGGAFGKGLGGLAVGLGMHGISSAFSGAERDSLHTKFLSALSSAIASNPILKNANKAKVQNYAETVFKFAPHVACDPNLLSHVLAGTIDGEGIDLMTIKTLGDLENRYVENRSSGGFSPKTYV